MGEINLNEIINAIKISTLFKFFLKCYAAMVLAAAPIAILFFLFWLLFFGTIIGGLMGLRSTVRQPTAESPTPSPKRISTNENPNVMPQTGSTSATVKHRKTAQKYDADEAARLEYESLQQEVKKGSPNDSNQKK